LQLQGFAAPGSAPFIYELLVENGRPGYRNSIVSWQILFQAIEKYAEEYHVCKISFAM
jgi:hypothetical protein